MKIRCITCKGQKTVLKSFPHSLECRAISFWNNTYHYYDRDSGERVGVPTTDEKGRPGSDMLPTEQCQTCDGTGWIDRETANFIIALRDK